jgi:hypothetical protein
MGRQQQSCLGKLGYTMGKRLGEDDALAIDLLLDRSSAATTNSSSTFATPSSDSVVQRIGAAEHVLRLLAEMPAADPPADLTHKTMERIRQHSNVAPGAVEGNQPIIPPETV